MPFVATWMQLEIILLSENLKEKGKYHMIHFYLESKYDINEPTYETKADSQTENKLVVAKEDER